MQVKHFLRNCLRSTYPVLRVGSIAHVTPWQFIENKQVYYITGKTLFIESGNGTTIQHENLLNPADFMYN